MSNWNYVSPPGTWGWYVIDPTTKGGWNNIRFLLSGFSATIMLSVLAAILSIIIGLVVALPGGGAADHIQVDLSDPNSTMHVY